MICCNHCKKRLEPKGDDVWRCPKCSNEMIYENKRMPPYTQDDLFVINRGIELYAGDFMQALGKALLFADTYNQNKIFEMWGFKLKKYYEMGGGKPK